MIKTFIIGSFVVYYVVGLTAIVYKHGELLYSISKKQLSIKSNEIMDKLFTHNKKINLKEIEMSYLFDSIYDQEYDFCNDLII
jgi:hypothetical protein